MHCRTSIQNTREFRSATVHKMSSEQVTQWSSSQGAALPRPRQDTANAHAILQSYYTTWVNEIWNTTFKERRWGRGRRKPNKRDILLSAKNQEGKGKKKKTPQPFVYLAWRAGCLGTGTRPSRGRSQLCCPAPPRRCPKRARALAGSALAPSTTPEQQQTSGAWGRDIHAASINAS